MKTVLLALFILLPTAINSYPSSPRMHSQAESRLKILHQLGTPVRIDEVEVDPQFSLRWGQITNRSDRAVKSIRLGCFIKPMRGHVVTQIGEENSLLESVLPGYSFSLPPQMIARYPQSDIEVVVFFVAEARYVDGTVWENDVAALRNDVEEEGIIPAEANPGKHRHS